MEKVLNGRWVPPGLGAHTEAERFWVQIVLPQTPESSVGLDRLWSQGWCVPAEVRATHQHVKHSLSQPES